MASDQATFYIAERCIGNVTAVLGMFEHTGDSEKDLCVAAEIALMDCLLPTDDPAIIHKKLVTAAYQMHKGMDITLQIPSLGYYDYMRMLSVFCAVMIKRVAEHVMDNTSEEFLVSKDVFRTVGREIQALVKAGYAKLQEYKAGHDMT